MRRLLVLIGLLGLASCARGQDGTPAALALSSPAFTAGGAIPVRFSAYGANRSPPLNWSPMRGARGYALVLDDPDASGGKPFVHWLVWNIPPTKTSLAEGEITGIEGTNDAGRRSYFGPRPPSGTHHYHVHVYALDVTLDLAAGADRASLARAMNGHVLAVGDMVGIYAAP
ncbi:MAG: YbhB/YbcL family Raf kinase inhibitor-like protein [Caulobacteraceae bacterium]